MKKCITVVLCLVLFCAMALPVSAAHMSVSASSSSVSPGESFTLTVSLSNDQPVSNGGVYLSYDNAVFEMVGGECLAGDWGGVTPSEQDGLFVCGTDTVVSGTVFVFNMQVKSGAAFGSYTISGTPSLGGADCSMDGISITVACDHSFGDASQADEAHHQRTCSVCGETATEDHNWDSGTVTKEANCQETGTKEVTCTDCGASKTETIPQSDYHPFGSWEQGDDASHCRTCTLCGAKDWAEHSWDSWETVQEPTCQEAGSIRYLCSVCGGAMMGQLDPVAHSYEVVPLDDSNHRLTCVMCGTQTEEAHLWDDAVLYDEEGHYQECADCGQELNRTPHIPGPEATETTDQVCTECGWILQPMGEHIHFFPEEWQSDATGHFHQCSGCDEKQDMGEHSYDHDCDPDCNVCHLQRQITHQPEETLVSDDHDHWKICKVCGEKLEKAAHIPGPEATFTAVQVCTECGYELSPIVAHDHVFDDGSKQHFHECVCGERYQAEAESCSICAVTVEAPSEVEAAPEEQFPWHLVCMILAGVVLILLITVIVLAACLGSRKKSQKGKKENQPKEEWYFE